MSKKDLIDLIKGSKFEYAYDKERKMYSTKVFLNKLPRILTMIVGNDYVEYSLADTTGNVLEIHRQRGNKLEFINYQKK